MIAGVATRRLGQRPCQAAEPSEIALRLTGRDYISHSAISTFQRCPLRYYFNYVAGLAPEFVSSSLVFGSAVHRALEFHCRRVFEGTAPPSTDELLSVYEQAWKDEGAVRVRFGKNESTESLRDLARRMLAAYLASDVSNFDSRLVAVEEEFRAAVIPGCPDLLGRVDLVDLNRNALRIVDFKTSRSKWNEAKVQESAPQMLLYAELLRPLAAGLGARDVRLEWIVVTKTKEPVVETHTLTPDPRQITRTKAVIQRAWAAIAGGHFYPSPSSMSCLGCSYWTACQRWEG